MMYRKNLGRQAQNKKHWVERSATQMPGDKTNQLTLAHHPVGEFVCCYLQRTRDGP